jgi:hypothetical protein
MEKDMRVEVRFYPNLNNVHISFSLREAAMTIAGERGSRLSEAEMDALETYLNMMPAHVQQLYERIAAWKEHQPRIWRS